MSRRGRRGRPGLCVLLPRGLQSADAQIRVTRIGTSSLVFMTDLLRNYRFLLNVTCWGEGWPGRPTQRLGLSCVEVKPCWLFVFDLLL